MHIALDNDMTPAEVRHFAGALAGEPLQSPTRRGIAALERSLPVKAARPVEFERRGHLKGVTHYTASVASPAEKTLIIGFSGIHHRLMMPTAWLLDCLNPRLYDVDEVEHCGRSSRSSWTRAWKATNSVSSRRCRSRTRDRDAPDGADLAMIPGSIAGAVVARCWRSVLLALGASLATAGIGTVQHLVAATLSRAAGVEMIHVPYANSGQALKDVQSRAVPVYFAFLGPIDGMLKSGQLKPLAVATRRRTSA